jgi:hypothetical protein
MFFAPDHIKRRSQDWGPGGIERRTADAWAKFIPSVDRWMKIVDGSGPAGVERVYREVLAGKAKPEQGHILSL